MKNILLLTVILFLQIGCTDFLSKNPMVGQDEPIETVEQLEGLINNATVNVKESNIIEGFATDDCGFTPDLYAKAAGMGIFTVLPGYAMAHYVEGIAAQAYDNLWNGLYKSIFTANLIIRNVDKVSGDPDMKARLKADAYFLRAYNFWLLVNYYALPYTEENKDKPGVPLKLTPLFSELQHRATIRQVYAQIDADIQEAYKVENSDVDPKLPWRVSKAAVKAFLTRYYLYLGDYHEALSCAEEALPNAPKLKDFNTLLPGNSATYKNPDMVLEYCETNDWSASKYLYWQEFYYARFSYIGEQWRVPSEQLLALYDKENDLRFKWFYIENGDRRFMLNENTYRYTIFEDGRNIISGPTIAEVLLNKAEAQARTGEWRQGMETLNILREKRFKPEGYTPMTAANQQEALKKILEERRRELPFACRWLDIRRFSVNETPEDDVEIKKDFWEVSLSKIDVTKPKTYTIPVGSPFYAWPINGVEIDASRGQIEQNVY